MTDSGSALASMTRRSHNAPGPQSPPGSASLLVLLTVAARDRVNQVVFLTTALVVALGYSLLLPFDYTQRFSFANWHYLDARLIAWSIVLGFGMAAVVALQVHAVRRVAAARTRSGALGGLAFVGSLLPSLLCCTPVIPTFLAFVGFSTLSVYDTTGTLQHFFATHQTEFFVGSLVLMALTAWWSVHRIGKATCLTDACEPDECGEVPRVSDDGIPSTVGSPR